MAVTTQPAWSAPTTSLTQLPSLDQQYINTMAQESGMSPTQYYNTIVPQNSAAAGQSDSQYLSGVMGNLATSATESGWGGTSETVSQMLSNSLATSNYINSLGTPSYDWAGSTTGNPNGIDTGKRDAAYGGVTPGNAAQVNAIDNMDNFGNPQGISEVSDGALGTFDNIFMGGVEAVTLGGLAGAVVAPAVAGLAGAAGASSGVAAGLGTAASGAAAGAATGAIHGNAALGALTGGVGAGLGYLGTQYLDPAIQGATGLPSGIVNPAVSTASKIGTGLLGNAVAGSSPAQASLNTALNGSAGNGMAIADGGNVGGAAVANNGSGIDWGSILGSAGTLAQAGASFYGASGTQQAQQGAYNMAATGGNYNPYTLNGIGGMGASSSNGTTNLSAGAFGNAANMFGGLAGQYLGSAGQYASGQNPSGVTAAGNTAMSVLNPNVTGTQSGLNSALGANQLSQNMSQALAQQGQSQLNNSLIGQANGNASSLLGSAGANYNSAYQTSLQSQLAALNPAIQQQSNALLNSNFERGQSGTSGGALNVQALQNSFNTADLQAQSNAVAQANALMGTTYNAANTASGIGTSQQLSGTNMLNSGLANYNTATGLSNTLNNSIYGQNTSLASLNAALGQQGLSTQENLSAFAPQLAGLYSSGANSAVSGFSSLNSDVLGNASLGATQGQQRSNAANTAGAVMSSLTTNPNYSANAGGALNGLLGGLTGGSSGGAIGNIMSALGVGGQSAANSIAGAENNYASSGALGINAANATAPNLNFGLDSLGGNASVGAGSGATASWDGSIVNDPSQYTTDSIDWSQYF